MLILKKNYHKNSFSKFFGVKTIKEKQQLEAQIYHTIIWFIFIKSDLEHLILLFKSEWKLHLNEVQNILRKGNFVSKNDLYEFLKYN